MNSSIDPMDIFQPSCAKPAEEKWHQGKPIVRNWPHNAIRWIKNFFFLRPSDRVRASLALMGTEEGTSHRVHCAWRVLGVTEGQEPGEALSNVKQSTEDPLKGSGHLWSTQEPSKKIPPLPPLHPMAIETDWQTASWLEMEYQEELIEK